MKMLSTMQVPSPTELRLTSVHLPELTIAMVSIVCNFKNTSTGTFCLFQLLMMYAYCTFFCLCLSADSLYWQKTGDEPRWSVHRSTFNFWTVLSSPSGCSSELRRIYVVSVLSLSVEASKLRHSTCDSVSFISSTVFLSLFVALKPLIERQADVKKTNCKTQV